MRKISTLILICLYTMGAVGAPIQLHYCMGKLVGFGISREASKKCSTCGMDKKKSHGCCKDETKQLHLEQDQQRSAKILEITNLPVSLPAYVISADLFLPSSSTLTPVSHAPPERPVTGVFLLNCNFRI